MEDQLRQLTIGKALLVGLGIAAFYYFVMYDDGTSRETNIANLKTQITQQQAEIAKMNTVIANAEQIKELAKNMSENLELVKQAAPESFSGLELMKILSSEAKIVGANIVSLNDTNTQRVSAKDKEEIFLPVKVSAQLEGTFNQLMLFLSNLTKTKKIIISERMQLRLKDAQRASSETASPILNFSGVFVAYKYNPEGEKKKSAQ